MSVTAPNTTHIDRVRAELKSAGISPLAMLRFTCRYLPKVIHDDEHIKAAVFGHHKINGGMLDFVEGILVATDRRILYLDHRPGFTTMDEIAYDVVSGVNVTDAALVSSLTLFTKIGNYTISFARQASVRRFADYIEEHRVDEGIRYSPSQLTSPRPNALEFLAGRHVAVLSTHGRFGNVNGAAVDYVLFDDAIYILTKDTTRKARNIYAHPQVALTIFDPSSLQELQIEAQAQIEERADMKEKVFRFILHSDTPIDPPPVAKLQNGAYVVLRLLPTNYSFSNFGR